MSETCIVCLGDLGESANDLPLPDTGPIKPEEPLENGAVRVTPTTTAARPRSRSNDSHEEMIAHLLPCGHDLHNECLKPWVERANSCPICRQSFNQVDLSQKVGGRSSSLRLKMKHTNAVLSGPIISSYAVADRVQIADIDPSMFTEDLEEELDNQPCPLCGEDDNEDHLLACDGCAVDFHTYCVDMDEIPIGHWFCETCATQRAVESVAHPTRQTQLRHQTPSVRTRAQRRRAVSLTQTSSSSWARVWQTVWDRLNLDLDFPFEEDPDAVSREQRQQHALTQQRREFREWERRFQVAERQGGANRFRETAPALLDFRQSRDRPQVPSLEPESPEEIRAWNAFEKAKEIQADPAPNRRKRKSATASPSDAEPLPQPERQLKRPRTRRALDLVDTPSDTSTDAAIPHRTSAAGPSSSLHPNPPTPASRDPGPSFLKSLLKEVETSSASDVARHRPAPLSATGHSSPRAQSPASSPTASNYGSPRAQSATPPPLSGFRPSSPIPLTSNVEPIYPPADYSPSTSQAEQTLSRRLEENSARNDEARKGRPRDRSPPSSSPPRSTNTSPSRMTMSLSAKAELQKLVSAALKPHYKNSVINKDQYTDINRNVSRMLYDIVGDNSTASEEKREEWERIATNEVEKAVKALPSTP